MNFSQKAYWASKSKEALEAVDARNSQEAASLLSIWVDMDIKAKLYDSMLKRSSKSLVTFDSRQAHFAAIDRDSRHLTTVKDALWNFACAYDKGNLETMHRSILLAKMAAAELLHWRS